MSFLSDIFGGGAQKAASAQEAGLMAALNMASPYLNANPGIITSLGGQALQPYTQNYDLATSGVGALGNLLGLNGSSGSQSALSTLRATPGYQFALNQGNNSINAAAASKGLLGSGNQLTALSNYDTGLADQTYQNAVNNLQPYLSFSNASAGGMANVLGDETARLTGNNDILAQLEDAIFTGIGNAQASANLAQGAGEQALFGGLLSGVSGLLGGFLHPGLPK